MNVNVKLNSIWHLALSVSPDFTNYIEIYDLPYMSTVPTSKTYITATINIT